MFKRLRILIIVAIVVIVGVVFLRAQMTTSSAATTTDVQETAVIDQGDVLITVSASGPIQANQTTNLSFQATGKVATIKVAQGAYVLKGQTIATLDNQAADDALLLAQAKVKSGQIALQRLTDPARQVDITVDKAALGLAQAQLDEALHSVDRTNAQIAQINVSTAKNSLYLQQLTRDADQQTKQNLLKNPLTAGQANQLPSDTTENGALTSKAYDLQIAQANADAAAAASGNVGSIASAQAQVTSAQNALDKLIKGADIQDITRAQANLKSAQAALDQAQAVVDKNTLIAPYDGVIGTLNIHVGEQAPAVGPAAVILDTSTFYVDLPIDEVDIAKVAVGQDVNLKFDALPNVIVPGTVTKIGEIGDKVGNVVTYTVRAQITPGDQALLSSMTATATIITGKVSGVIRIPNRFVRVDRSSGNTYATVRQKDNTYKEVQITLGLRNDTLSEVTNGLHVGDVVAPPLTVQNNPFSGGGPGGGGGGGG